MIAGSPISASDALASLERMSDGALGHIEADALHRLAEQLSVLGLVDGLERGADQLTAKTLERAGLGQRLGRVQRRLPAHGRQQRIRALTIDDPCHHIGG